MFHITKVPKSISIVCKTFWMPSIKPNGIPANPLIGLLIPSNTLAK
ncbi:MAG: hypothetical protein RSD47_06655 [Romboutsia sp.]